MTTLTCPRCGHPVELHFQEGCVEYNEPTEPHTLCECSMSGHKSTRLAQRRKAAARLAQYVQEGEGDASGRCQDGIDTYVEALRDTGILGENETESDLLKELEGEPK